MFGTKATEAYGQRAGEMRPRDKLSARQHLFAHGAAEFIGGVPVPFGAGAQGVKGLMNVGAGAAANMTAIPEMVRGAANRTRQVER